MWEWFHCQYVLLSPEHDSQNAHYEILFYLHNLTEKIHYENKLKEEKANLQALIESSHNPIFSVDKQLNIKICNTAFLNLIRRFYPEIEQITDQPLTQVFPQEEASFWISHIQKAFLGEKQETAHSIHFKRQGNTHYEVAFYPIIEESQITGVTVIARDITEQENMRYALEKSNYELDTFIYRSSHDLRAPLSSILGLLQLLRMPLPNEEKDRYIQLIESSVAKLDRITYSLIDFSRNMHLPLEFHYVEVEQIVYSCYEQLKHLPHADRVNIHLHNTCKQDLISDENRLRIIIYHLLSNSIRYQDLHKEETHVNISISCNQDSWKLSFKDNGRGIPEAIKKDLFRMFQRSNEENRGAGLGLYIIKQVVQKLQGEVHVESQIGEGTHVSITLPFLKETVVVL
jgi:PAS domain S-box-containing protein